MFISYVLRIVDPLVTFIITQLLPRHDKWQVLHFRITQPLLNNFGFSVGWTVDLALRKPWRTFGSNGFYGGFAGAVHIGREYRVLYELSSTWNISKNVKIRMEIDQIRFMPSRKIPAINLRLWIRA